MARHLAVPAEASSRTSLTDVPQDVTGLSIVATANHVEWLESHPDHDSHDAAGGWHEALLEELGDFSNQLLRLPKDKAERLAPYMHTLISDESRLKRVSGVALVAGLAREEPTVQVDYLRRHVAVLEQLQLDTRPFNEDSKRQFVSGILAWVGKAWSPSAGEVQDTVPATEIRIGDWWATNMEWKYGYHYYGTDHVVVAQTLGHTRQQRSREYERIRRGTIFHELSHKEFDMYLPPELLTDDLYTEAFAEHLALSLEHGRPDVIFPAERDEPNEIYYWRRMLMGEVMADLPANLWTRAMTCRDPHGQEWRELDSALYEKYGVPGVMQLLLDRYTRHRQYTKEWDLNSQIVDSGEYAAHQLLYELKNIPSVVMAGQVHKKPQHAGAAAMRGVHRR